MKPKFAIAYVIAILYCSHCFIRFLYRHRNKFS